MSATPAPVSARAAARTPRRRLPEGALLACAALFVGAAWFLARPGSPLRPAEPALAFEAPPLVAHAPSALSEPPPPAAPAALARSPRALALRTLIARGVAAWTEEDYGRTTHHEFVGLYPAWLEDDLAAASRALLGLPADWDKGEFLALATAAWLEQGPDLAAAFSETLAGDATLHEEALLRVASAWADQDPAAASAWLSGRADLPQADKAAGELARRWAERDPRAALAWVDTLPEGELRDRAQQRAAIAWLRSDPLAAARHFEALPAERQGDPVRVALARAASSEDPGSAVLWARAVANPELRRSVLLDTLPALMRADPPAARALAAELRLSPEALRALTGS